jgi:hypothetical protein
VSTQDPVDVLVSEIVSEIEKGSIVVVVVDKRTGMSVYNYKTDSILVVWKPIRAAWEEQLIRDVKVTRITVGMYQQYPLNTGSIIEHEMRNRGYMVEVVNL